MSRTEWTPCPFCEGQYMLESEPQYQALHTMPPCWNYMETDDALAFAIAARKAAMIPDPQEN